MHANRRGAPGGLCLNTPFMPKTKTHSGAKKRFRRTARGKIKARHPMLSHNTGKKRPKRKRRLGRPAIVAKQDEKRVQELLHK